MKRNYTDLLLLYPILLLLNLYATDAWATEDITSDSLPKAIRQNVYFPYVKQKAREIVRACFEL